MTLQAYQPLNIATNEQPYTQGASFETMPPVKRSTLVYQTNKSISSME